MTSCVVCIQNKLQIMVSIWFYFISPSCILLHNLSQICVDSRNETEHKWCKCLLMATQAANLEGVKGRNQHMALNCKPNNKWQTIRIFFFCFRFWCISWAVHLNLTVSSIFLGYLPRTYWLVFLSVGAPQLCHTILSSFCCHAAGNSCQVVVDNPKLNSRQRNQFLFGCM